LEPIKVVVGNYNSANIPRKVSSMAKGRGMRGKAPKKAKKIRVQS
jgi:hypothetical protein